MAASLPIAKSSDLHTTCLNKRVFLVVRVCLCVGGFICVCVDVYIGGEEKRRQRLTVCRCLPVHFFIFISSFHFSFPGKIFVFFPLMTAIIISFHCWISSVLHIGRKQLFPFIDGNYHLFSLVGST